MSLPNSENAAWTVSALRQPKAVFGRFGLSNNDARRQFVRAAVSIARGLIYGQVMPVIGRNCGSIRFVVDEDLVYTSASALKKGTLA